MRFAAFHFALALLWTMLSDEPGWQSPLIGLGIAHVLWHGDWIVGRRRRITPRKVAAVLRLSVRFVFELIKSNIEVTAAVLRAPQSMRPSIVAIPVAGMSDGAITLLANMITLTPGTTSLDVTPDRATLYVHALFGADPEGVKAGIEDAFARTIREIWS